VFQFGEIIFRNSSIYIPYLKTWIILKFLILSYSVTWHPRYFTAIHEYDTTDYPFYDGPRSLQALSHTISASVKTSRDSRHVDGHHKGDILYNNLIKSKKVGTDVGCYVLAVDFEKKKCQLCVIQVW